MTKEQAIAKFREIMRECLDADIVAVMIVADEGPVEEARVLHTIQTNEAAAKFLSDVARYLGRSDA